MKFLLLLPLFVVGAARVTSLTETPTKPAAILGRSATIRIADARNVPTVRVAQSLPQRRIEQPQIRAEDVVKSVAAAPSPAIRTPVSTAAADVASQQATVALTTNSIPLSSAAVIVASASRYNGSAGCGGESRGSGYYRTGLLGRLFGRR